MSFPLTTDQINRRADQLGHEFLQHYREVVAAHPDANDRRLIFEAWVMQKLAALQLLNVAIMASGPAFPADIRSVVEEFLNANQDPES